MPDAPADERRWVTVVFADIAGFTAMSEQLDFEEVRDIADLCSEVMGEEVRRFGGQVLNVMGDAVMAVFGAPVAHDDDPERAVRASLAMIAAIPKATPPEHNLALHIGVNTGEVMAGLLGPTGRKDYTVMGDTINTGARLEAAAVRGEVVVGRETFVATRHAIRYGPHEPVSAKGKQEKVEAWLAIEPLAIRANRVAKESPWVGREYEMELLEKLWNRTRDEPKAQLVTLIAPPGIGKTRLGREFAAVALAGGALVLTGRSLPYGESTGYRPFADQLRAGAGLTVDMAPSEVAAKLAEHVQSLFNADQPEVVSNLLAILGLRGDDAVPEKDVLFYSARRWLAALARRTPTVLFFEDVHWADATLIELIGSIASRVGPVPVMLLCLARPQLLEQHPEWGAGQAAHTAVTIEPLSPEASRRLSEALLGDRPRDVVERLVLASGGNPLFVEELSATVSEQVSAGPTELPTSVISIIGARLDLLSEGERRVLVDAAVVGDVFWRGLVAELSEGLNVDFQLDELQARGLVRREEVSALPGDEQFIFKHALIREVAYGRLPRRARRERHAIVAARIEKELGSGKDEMAAFIAHHWDEAGEAAAAARYYVLAADRASKAWAKKEATALYSRAIDLITAEGDAELVADLRVRRARAYSGVGDLAGAVSDLELALPALTGIDRAWALIERARIAFLAADAEGIVRYAAEATSAATTLHNRLVDASALAVQSTASLMGGKLEEATEMRLASVASWPETDRDNDPEFADNLSNLALYHYWRGDYQQSVDVAREAVERGLAVQALQPGAQGTAHLAMALVGLGRHGEALGWFERSVNLGLEWEAVPRYSGRSMNMWAGSVRELMDFKEARSLSERGLEMAHRAQFPAAIHSAAIDLFILDVVAGRLGEAELALPDLRRAARETKGFHNWLFEIRVAEAGATLALAMGRPGDGVEDARTAVLKANELKRKKYQAQAATTLSRCLLGAGHVEEAAASAATAVAVAETLGHPHSFWRAADALSRARAAQGDDDAASQAARSAADEVRRFGHSLEGERAETFLGANEVTQVLARA